MRIDHREFELSWLTLPKTRKMWLKWKIGKNFLFPLILEVSLGKMVLLIYLSSHWSIILGMDPVHLDLETGQRRISIHIFIGDNQISTKLLFLSLYLAFGQHFPLLELQVTCNNNKKKKWLNCYKNKFPKLKYLPKYQNWNSHIKIYEYLTETLSFYVFMYISIYNLGS